MTNQIKGDLVLTHDLIFEIFESIQSDGESIIDDGLDFEENDTIIEVF